jgi:hypothetical protein
MPATPPTPQAPPPPSPSPPRPPPPPHRSPPPTPLPPQAPASPSPPPPRPRPPPAASPSTTAESPSAPAPSPAAQPPSPSAPSPQAAHSYTAVYGGNASYASSTSSAVAVTASSGPYLVTTFNEFAAGHAFNATAPATDGPGTSWSDPNGDWKYTGSGVVSSISDLNYPALINLNQANYAATFTYPTTGAILLFRYADVNDYVYAETFSFGAIALYSKVAGTSTQLAILWTGSPGAPLTVTLTGSTGSITVAGQTASGTIPSSLLSGTQVGFFSPSPGFTISGLSVALTSQATATTTALSASSTNPVAGANITLTATTSPSAATGTVTFLDGANTLGTGTLSGGTATFAVNAIAAGAHSYTASYAGNSSYAASASSAVAVTAQATTTTTLAASNTISRRRRQHHPHRNPRALRRHRNRHLP